MEGITAAELNELLEAVPVAEDFNQEVLLQRLEEIQSAESANAKARADAPDDPLRFMDSELGLQRALARLRPLALHPNLFPFFLSEGGLRLLARLLAHPNVDIAAAVAELCAELVEAPNDDDGELGSDDSEAESGSEMIRAAFLTETIALDGLVDHIAAAEISGQDPGLAALLALALQLTEDGGAEAASKLLRNGRLAHALIRLMKRRTDFREVQLSVAELLSALAQAGESARSSMGSDSRILDGLLTAVHFYRSTNPASLTEEEFVLNVFQAIDSLLMDASARSNFIRAEGLELMVLLAKSRGFVHSPALRVLGDAVRDDPVSCEAFVQAGGLPVLFSELDGTGEHVSKRRNRDMRQLEPLWTLLATLLLHIQDEACQARLLYKLVENGATRLGRLADLHAMYSKKLAIALLENASARAALVEAKVDQEMMASAQEGFENRLLDEGKLILQSVDIVLACVILLLPAARAIILASLHRHNISLQAIDNVLDEFLREMDDDLEDSSSSSPSSPVARVRSRLMAAREVIATALVT